MKGGYIKQEWQKALDYIASGYIVLDQKTNAKKMAGLGLPASPAKSARADDQDEFIAEFRRKMGLGLPASPAKSARAERPPEMADIVVGNKLRAVNQRIDARIIKRTFGEGLADGLKAGLIDCNSGCYNNRLRMHAVDAKRRREQHGSICAYDIGWLDGWCDGWCDRYSELKAMEY